jgi:hypothetical protein
MLTKIDDEERKRILRDGEVLHVPCMARDSALPPVPGFDAYHLHRPGPRSTMSDAAVAAYHEMIKRNEGAWRSPQRAVADTERDAEPPLCEDAREDAYQRHKKWLVNAWRGAR